MLQGVGYAVVLVGGSDVVGHVQQFGHGIAHGDADAGTDHHLLVVGRITESHNAVLVQAQIRRQLDQRVGFGGVQTADLDVVRGGTAGRDPGDLLDLRKPSQPLFVVRHDQIEVLHPVLVFFQQSQQIVHRLPRGQHIVLTLFAGAAEVRQVGQIFAVRVHRVIEEDLQHHVFVVQIRLDRIHRLWGDQVFKQDLARMQVRNAGAVAGDRILHALHRQHVLGECGQHSAGRDHHVISLLHGPHDGRLVAVGQLAVSVQQRIVHVESQDLDLVQPLLGKRHLVVHFHLAPSGKINYLCPFDKLRDRYWAGGAREAPFDGMPASGRIPR